MKISQGRRGGWSLDLTSDEAVTLAVLFRSASKGLTADEIAASSGLSPATIRQRVVAPGGYAEAQRLRVTTFLRLCKACRINPLDALVSFNILGTNFVFNNEGDKVSVNKIIQWGWDQLDARTSTTPPEAEPEPEPEPEPVPEPEVVIPSITEFMEQVPLSNLVDEVRRRGYAVWRP